jgi:hypothetical protein
MSASNSWYTTCILHNPPDSKYNQRKVLVSGRLEERREYEVGSQSVWLDIKHTFNVQGVTVDSATGAKLRKQCLLVGHNSMLIFKRMECCSKSNGCGHLLKYILSLTILLGGSYSIGRPRLSFMG